MSKRKWILTTSAFLMILLLLTGYMAIAAEFGSQDDPVVALSYITDVLAPEILENVNDNIELKSKEFSTEMNQKLTEYTTQLDTTIAEFEERNLNIATDAQFIDAVTTQVLARMNGTSAPGTTVTPGASIGGGNDWKLIEIKKGQTVVFEVGGMCLLRIGDATCVAPSDPGLINLTTATVLGNGGDLSKNNLYMITVQGRGFKGTGSTNKLLVSGTYTISE